MQTLQDKVLSVIEEDLSKVFDLSIERTYNNVGTINVHPIGSLATMAVIYFDFQSGTVMLTAVKAGAKRPAIGGAVDPKTALQHYVNTAAPDRLLNAVNDILRFVRSFKE